MLRGDKLFAGNRAHELERRLAEANARIKVLESSVQTAAGRDPLTGLLNLARLRAQLDVEVTRARRHGRPLSVAVFDIDGFRAINSHHGYSAGDEVLVAVGRVFAGWTRAHDLSARTGADEFTVLMPETDADGAYAAVERMVLELEALELGPVRCVSVSVGISTFDRWQSASEFIGRGSEALDRARKAGGGRIMRHDAPVEDMDEGQRDAVVALATTLLERDRYTGEHSESVVDMATAVARSLGLDHEQINCVRNGALLHDIGKVGIPDDVLRKNGPLDEAEWELMKQHPVIGERILRAIPGMGCVARIVRHEHERWDGNGYPDGIAGEAIPVGARIILACDAYHAMTSDRPYRKAMSHGDALKELVAGAGQQFDPQVVEVLIGHLYGNRQTRRRAEAEATEAPSAGDEASAPETAPAAGATE